MTHKDRIKFHQVFCSTQVHVRQIAEATQMRAQQLAEAFNEKLALIPGVNPYSTPRIAFLDCSVFEIDIPGETPFGLLVEPMIDPAKYCKYNSNNGFVLGGQKQAPEELLPLPDPTTAPLPVRPRP
ncbi:hypothetical protein T484DRAFT_1763825 [Baffinella frigidus]|nr:hypothetical protein T484DRAFT_1763825 [Cryptophyta sp. CCMP2293]